MKGWLRATLHCEQNLTVPSSATGLRFRWLNSITNQYVYKPADMFHTSIQANECRAGDYYYYFDLSDTLVRMMLDSGVCEFKLQACCNGDIAETPYYVTFHLLADPSGSCNTLSYTATSDSVQCSGQGCAWLPLSRAGERINVHCAGCSHTGCIVSHYRLNRTTFGLADSDNDGVADMGAAVITPGSAWYQQYGNRLKTNYSSMDDELEDYLRAHTQEGDPTYNNGYDQSMLDARGAFLKYLQLSRSMTGALDTMKLSVTGFTLYVDTPNTTQPNCIDCNDYGADSTRWRTQHIIRVTGNDVWHYLDTSITDNTFLFTFSAYDSSGAVYGNVFDPNLTTYYYTDSQPPLTRFFEKQQYRLKVSYRECGTFSAPEGSTTLPIEAYMKRCKILNKMWLSGKKQNYDAYDMNLSAPNNITEAQAAGWTFDPQDTSRTLINQQFADTFIFMCEAFGGLHYYFAQNAYNSSNLMQDTACNYTVQLNSYIKSAAGQMDIYPYEYRLAVYAPQSYTIKIPQGWHSVAGSGKMQNISYYGNQNQKTIVTHPRYFAVPGSSGTIHLYDSLMPQPECAYDGLLPLQPNDSALYLAGYSHVRMVSFHIAPDQCPDDSLKMNKEDLSITYHKGEYTCYPSHTCDTVIATTRYTDLGIPTLANLTSGYNSQIYASSHQICFDLTINNYNTTSQNFAAASYLYAVLPDNMPFFDNWQYTINGGTSHPAQSGIIPLADTLQTNNSLLLHLCADYQQCIEQDSASFVIRYGWNCNGYPSEPFQVQDVCFADSAMLMFHNLRQSLDPTPRLHDSTYTLCSNFEISMTVNNTGQGAVYPIQVYLDSLVSSLQVENVIISNCTTQASDTLMATGINTWGITGANMAAIGYADSSLTVACMKVKVIVNPTCDYRDVNVLPGIYVDMYNNCNDTITQSALRIMNMMNPANDTIVWNGQSACTDCWQITKTADRDTAAAVTDLVTYTITVCNNSANTQTGVLADALPNGFIQTNSTLPGSVTLNSMQCDTFTVAGYFGNAATGCLFNTVSVTSPANTTWKDSVCVNVKPPCTDSTTFIIPHNTYSTTLNYRYDTLNIYIAGTLYVNDTLKFMRCMVLMDEKAQIVVQNGGYLDIDSSTVQGCLTMWRGITVEDLGELIIQEGSTVADGDTTVFANDKAKVNIHNAYFRNFVLGVYMPPKAGALYNGTTLTVQQATFEFTSFKPDYTGQNPHGLKSQCGILLNDWIGTIGTYIQDYWLNKFINLNSGIAAERSQLTVKNSFFSEIQRDLSISKPFNGTAIYSKGNSALARAGNLTVQPVMNNAITMTNCYRGVFADYSNLSITNVRMDSMWLGIHTTFGKDYLETKITGNEIKAYRSGVMTGMNAGAMQVDISENNIYVYGSGNAASSGIVISEANKVGISSYMLNNNRIYLYDAKYGIRMLNAYKPIVAHNYIEQNGISPFGIYATGSDSSFVRCNQVRTTDIGNTASKGIYYSISQNGTIACNFIDTTATGIYIGGNCAGTQLKGNTMRNNMLGLYINNVGLTGVQSNNGNKFIDYRDTIGAYNANLQLWGLGASRFDLKNGTQQGSIYYPVLAQQNNGWFVPSLPNNPYQCGTTCYDMLDEPNNEILYRIIASDSVLTEEFIPESQSMARQYLFEVLQNNPDIRESDTLFQNFYTLMLDEAEGQLKEVERNFERYSKMDSTFIPMLNNIDSLVSVYNYYKAHFDEMRDSIEHLGMNADSLKEAWYVQIENLDITRANIVMQHNAVISGEMYEGELTNNIIQPDEVPEYNSARLNEIFMILEDGNYSNIDEYYTELSSIAGQCPYYGGEAVYRARAVIALVNDSIDYNDDVNCLLYGIYRNAQTIAEIGINIIVKPNPANEYVLVTVSCKDDELFNAEIRDGIGQILYAGKLKCNKENKISIGQFKQGVYTLIVKTKEGSSVYKIAIIR